MGPRRVPGEPRGRPKRLPGHPWSAPRSPRGAPRVAQSHPEAPRSTPKRVKWRQKRSQDRFSSRIWCRTTFEGDFRSIFHRFSIKIVSDNDWRIDRELRREVASKLTSINPAMLRKSWFYLGKTTLFVISAKKQTRQSNAKSRRNQHRKHSGKTTCAKHVDATVSPTVSVPENHEK